MRGQSCHENLTVVYGMQVIPGKEDSCISCLAWVKDPLDKPEALISGGLDGILTEWDLTMKIPKHVGDSFGGAVWDIAVEPDSQSEQGTLPRCSTTDYSLIFCTAQHKHLLT